MSNWTAIPGHAIAAVGALRIIAHPLNAMLKSYILKRVSPTQFIALTTGGSKSWKAIDFGIHLLTSISPSALFGAITVNGIGDSDSKIVIPYKTSQGLPPNSPPQNTKPTLPEPQQVKLESQ